MAFTFTEMTEYAVTTNASSYTTSSYTPTADRLLLASVIASGTAWSTPTGAGNGLTWTREIIWVGARILVVFSALTGSSPSAGGFTFDCTGDAATGAIIHVVEVDGVDLTTPIVQSAANNGTNPTAPSCTFSAATASDCAVWAFACQAVNPAGITEPSGYTELMDTGFNTPSMGGEAAYHASPGSVTTVTWQGSTSTLWQAILVELAAAGGGPGPITPKLLAALGVG